MMQNGRDGSPAHSISSDAIHERKPLGGLPQTFPEVVKLFPEPSGKTVAEPGEMPLDVRRLGLPGGRVDTEELFQVRRGNGKSRKVDSAPIFPSTRSHIHFRTRLFSPKPGQSHLPSGLFRNQFT